jgi:hypothetical protein
MIQTMYAHVNKWIKKSFRLLLWCLSCSEVCSLISTYLWTFLLLLICTFKLLWLAKMLGMIPIFKNLLRFISNTCPTLKNIACTLNNNVFSAAAAVWNALYMSLRSMWPMTLFKSSVSLLIFCLHDLYIAANGLFKYLTIMALLLLP